MGSPVCVATTWPDWYMSRCYGLLEEGCWQIMEYIQYIHKKQKSGFFFFLESLGILLCFAPMKKSLGCHLIGKHVKTSPVFIELSLGMDEGKAKKKPYQHSPSHSPLAAD